MKTLSEKQQLSIEERTKRQQEEGKLRALFDKYTGETEGLEVLVPTKELVEAGWNTHNLFPVTKEDPVYKHPGQKDIAKGYVRVIYHNGEHVATLSKTHFE